MAADGVLWGLCPWYQDGCPALRIAGPWCLCILVSFSYKDTCHIELGSSLMASFYPNYLFKEPVSKYSPILKCWGLGL